MPARTFSSLKLYGYATAAALCWSLYPVVLLLGGGKASVWFQIALMLVSHVAFFFCWLKRRNPEFVTAEAVKIAWREIRNHRFILLAQRTALPVYLVAAVHADPAVSAVLIETWIVFYFAAEFRSNDTDLAEKVRLCALLAFALVGVTGVVWSQYGQFGTYGLWAAAIVVACAVGQGSNVTASMQHGRSVAAGLRSGDAVGGGCWRSVFASRF